MNIQEKGIHVGPCTSRSDFLQLLSTEDFRRRIELEKHIAKTNNQNEVFFLPGICRACDKAVDFRVDRNWGGRQIDGIWIPNWRERLTCPLCRLNNRQRAVAAGIKAFLGARGAAPEPRLYFMEQITPIFEWVRKCYPLLSCDGSEYLGPTIAGGTLVNGIRHEDVECLSFAADSLDLIVSNDVLEHVNDPCRALRELVRVLRPRGELLLTIPFASSNDRNIHRAQIVNGQIEHLLPPMYHGNPVSTDGSLVFTDFGWEVLEKLRESGFSHVSLTAYWSLEYGHLGGAQIYFYAVK